MSTESRDRRRWVAPALVVALLGVAGLTISRTGAADAVDRYLPWRSSAPSCQTMPVTVVAAPQISDVVRRAVTPVQGRRLADRFCVQVLVRSQTPTATVENAPSTPTPQLPQLWIPDSSLWQGQSPAWSTRPVGSLATTPVVLAISAASVSGLRGRTRDISWAQGLDAAHHVVVAPAMTQDASALLGLLALARTMGPGSKTEQNVAATVLAASRIAAPDLDSAVELVRSRAARAPAVLLTNEQAIVSADRKRSGGLLTVRPTGPAAELDFPILRVGRADEDLLVRAATDIVVGQLTGPDARRAANAAGFGPPAPQTPAIRGASARAAKATAEFVTQVRTLAVPSRLLVAMDTSSSMGLPVQGASSRAQLAATAAIGAGRLLADRSAIGLWSFAGAQPGRRPYRVLAKIGAIGAVDKSGPRGKQLTHQDNVNSAVALLPRRLGGGDDALYDTALAALRALRGNYDPHAKSSVLLFTDGANNFAAGISLSTFLRTAKAEAAADPARAVRLIAIGIGPEADMKALRAMCQAAGGRAYRVESAAEMQSVLFDAVAHRQVVPGQAAAPSGP